jgi:hypothetical protein
MKNHSKISFIAAFLISFISLELSAEVLKRAVIRDDNFNAIIQEVSLEDLTCQEKYVGSFFKIVKRKSEEAIRFYDAEEIQLKAATTYYHLTKARNYFARKMQSKYVISMPQVTIRLEITNVFNEVGHFGNDKLSPQFNNALSIPSGDGYKPANIPAWNSEIWFRPSKEIHIKDLSLLDNSGKAVQQSLKSFRNQTHISNFKNFFLFVIANGITLDASNIVKNMMRFAECSILVEMVYQSTDIAAEFFSRKIYRLDTALVPEIIYHEYSHIALSDRLELTHSTPVIEGMADFFAGKIANSKKLATHIKDYNLFNGKEVKNKQLYNIAFEKGEFANTDFVFGLLWNVGATVGIETEAEFINEMANKLTTNSNIREDLINASLNTCTKLCKSPLNDRIKLYKLFNKKGL